MDIIEPKGKEVWELKVGDPVLANYSWHNEYPFRKEEIEKYTKKNAKKYQEYNINEGLFPVLVGVVIKETDKGFYIKYLVISKKDGITDKRTNFIWKDNNPYWFKFNWEDLSEFNIDFINYLKDGIEIINEELQELKFIYNALINKQTSFIKKGE